MTQAEFNSILGDQTKVIDGNIIWSEDEDHSPAVEFRAAVTCRAGYPLSVRGSYNPEAQALTYALIYPPIGRIYGLDLGKDHHNPTCSYVGERHKHSWTELYRDKEAYAAADIRAEVSDPVEVWKEFCKEASIDHRGILQPVPPQQKLLFKVRP